MYVSKRFLYIISFSLFFTGQLIFFRVFPPPDYLFSIPGQVLFFAERMGYAALGFLFGAFVISRLNPSLQVSLWRLLLFSAVGGFFYFIVEYNLMQTMNGLPASVPELTVIFCHMIYVLLLSIFLAFLFYFVILLSFPGQRLFCKPGKGILFAYAGVIVLIPFIVLLLHATLLSIGPSIFGNFAQKYGSNYQSAAQLFREMAPFALQLVTALWIDKNVGAAQSAAKNESAVENAEPGR